MAALAACFPGLTSSVSVLSCSSSVSSSSSRPKHGYLKPAGLHADDTGRLDAPGRQQQQRQLLLPHLHMQHHLLLLQLHMQQVLLPLLASKHMQWCENRHASPIAGLRGRSSSVTLGGCAHRLLHSSTCRAKHPA